MKKKNLKNLALKKDTIAAFKLNNIKGGTDWPDTAKYCPIEETPSPELPEETPNGPLSGDSKRYCCA